MIRRGSLQPDHLLLTLMLALLSSTVLAGEASEVEAGALACSSGDGFGLAFRKILLSSPGDLKELEDRFGGEVLGLIEKINRRDRRHLQGESELWLPCEILPENYYAPFPWQINVLHDLPKLILVSLRIQAFAAYEKGFLVRWGPISSGHRKQVTPSSLYYTNWKSILQISSIDSSWILPWYFNLHTSMGVAFHHYSMPGYPASYGCIRLLERDAQWVYGWAEEWIRSSDETTLLAFGTPVIVFGEYDYDSPPPWQSLDPLEASVSLDRTEEVFYRYANVIRERFFERLRTEEDERRNSDLQETESR